MANISELSVWTANAEDESVAATATSPYFCFVAESEEAALRVVGSALRFYLKVTADESHITRERIKAAPNFQTGRKLSARELSIA